MPSAVFVVAETVTSTGLSSDTVKANVVVPLLVSVTEGLLIETVAVSSLVIVPMPVRVAVLPVNCTLRPLALKAESTSFNCSSSSTLLSPLIVTLTAWLVVDPALKVTVPLLTAA